MPKLITEEYINKQYGMLTVLDVIYKVSGNKNQAHFVCSCGCGSGKIKVIAAYSVKNGTTQSCGCSKKKPHKLHNNRIRKKCLDTGYRNKANNRYYSIYHDMRQRCYNKNNKSYVYYGGRGITVCDCIPDYETFYNHMSQLPNFGKQGYTLDRKDNNGNYCICTNNLRWADLSTQNSNKRKCIKK